MPPNDVRHIGWNQLPPSEAVSEAFSLRSWTTIPDADDPHGYFLSFQMLKDDYTGLLTTKYTKTSSSIVADRTAFKDYIPPDAII